VYLNGGVHQALYPDGTAATSSASSSCNDLASAAAYSQDATITATLQGLQQGTDYRVEVEACNELGGSVPMACICTASACTASCDSAAGIVHTGAPPDKPAAPFASADPAYESLRSRTLFLQWAAPTAAQKHYADVTESYLSISNTTRTGSITFTTFRVTGSATTFNVSEDAGLTLQPATQYPVLLRTCNRYGCSAWSDQIWLSTTPDVPEPPAQVYCDQTGQLPDTLHFFVPTAEDNGVEITSYEVDIYNGVTVVEQKSYGTPGWKSEQSDKITSDNTYSLKARATNSLGWGPYSTLSDSGCTTQPLPPSLPPPMPPGAPPQAPPEPPFNWLLVIIPLSIFIGLLILLIILWRFTELPKILAPRLRKVEDKEDPLEDFIIREDTPMEDLDPELKLNPVIVAKIELEKEAARKGGKGGKGKKAAGAYGPGALKRLGINITPTATPAEKKQAGLKGIDVMLQQQNQLSKSSAASAALRASAGGGHTAGAAGAAGAAGRPSSRREEKSTVDFGRTLTLMSQKKRDKNKALIADRMVKDAEKAKCAASSAALARAANAKLATAGEELGAVTEED